MAPKNICRLCEMRDTLDHRLTACGEGRAIWEYAKSLMTQMLRTILSRIFDDWLLHPQFRIWPPKRRRAILWTLAQTILFRTQQQRTPGLPAEIEIEGDSLTKGERKRGKLPHSPGWGEGLSAHEER
jgi:hypothetical protein